MKKEAARDMSIDSSVESRTWRIAGLVVHKTFNPRIIPVLEELRDAGMKCVYRSEVIIAPDERFLFVLSDRPFSSDEQRLEADSILTQLIDSDNPDPIRYTTRGEFGEYTIIDFVRV